MAEKKAPRTLVRGASFFSLEPGLAARLVDVVSKYTTKDCTGDTADHCATLFLWPAVG